MIWKCYGSGLQIIYAKSVNYTFVLDMSEILDNIYIWVFLVNSESVLLLAFVKYMLYSHCTENCIFCTFWRLKTLVLWRKIVQNLLIFVYLFCPKNSTIDSRKTSITQERLFVESYQIPRWIVFLMLHRLVCNIRSYFNELVLAWSAYLNIRKFSFLKYKELFWGFRFLKYKKSFLFRK